MPPDEQQLGQAQEDRVRSYLVSLGYVQPYGTTDGEIRHNLGIRGKCADFVGYHPILDRWLIAESKGGNLGTAEAQLENTLKALVAKELSSVGKLSLQLHIQTDQYNKLLEASAEFPGPDGYYLRESDPYLGYYGYDKIWNYSVIQGVRIVVAREV